MDEKMIEFCTNPLFIALVVLIVAGFIVTVWRGIRSRGAWGELTRRTGLRLQPVKTSALGRLAGYRYERALAGTYRGRDVAVYQYRVKQRDSELDSMHTSHRYTTVNVSVRAIPDTWLTVQPMLALGKKPLAEISDEELERRFSIRSQPEGFARAVLASQNVRRQLMDLASFNRVIFNQGRLSCERSGVVTRADDLERTIEVLSDLADAVEEHRGPQ
jgi:hypothetical protein